MRLCLILLLCCVGGIAAGASANAIQQESPLAAGTDLDDPGAGRLLIYGVAGPAAAMQLSADADIRVTGLVAKVQLRQRFRNDSDQWVRGEYLFPLPEDAAVNQLKLTIGERVILGEIREKQEARKVYEAAAASGRKASLVEQRRPNLFSNRIANIGPGETVIVELTYLQRVRYRDGSFSLRFPMTLTPRYTPESMGAAAAEVWNVQLPTPSPRSAAQQSIKLTANINMGMPLSAVSSPYHPITMTRQGSVYDIALAEGSAAMDRDLLLTWRAPPGSEPRAAVFHERLGAEEYALLMVLPPSAPAAERAMPRELIFIIDTSGSMGGTSIQQARASLAFGLDQLQPEDHFNIIEFNNSARALYRKAVPANPHYVARAREFVRHLDAGGGTEMRTALEMALPQPAPESNALRQVVFITDGAVGNEVELFRLIQQRLGASRLFTVGIGSAPNSWFMRKAAKVGRGDFVYVGDILEVQQHMQTLFTRLSQPLMKDVQVDWPVTVDAYPRQVPDLYPGEPLWIAARSDSAFGGSNVEVHGQTAGKAWKRALSFAPPVSGMEQAWTGIGTLWARAAIESLQDEKILGRDESEVRAAILPIALKHQLVSPYTSFVAVEQQPSRPAEAALKKSAVPNLPPHGQAPQPYAWPRTATAAPLQLLVGTLFLVLACVFWRFSAWSWR